MPIAVVGLFFLQPGGVWQKYLEQVGRRPRGEHRPVETELYDARQKARVIDVGVGNNDRIKLIRRERRILPVTLTKLSATLKQAAINENSPTVGFEEIF